MTGNSVTDDGSQRQRPLCTNIRPSVAGLHTSNNHSVGDDMKKLLASLAAVSLFGCGAINSAQAQSTGPIAGQVVRIATGLAWQFETDVVVKSSALLDPPPIVGWVKPDGTIGYEGPFVAWADVIFAGQDGASIEKAINSGGLDLWGSAVLEPGTKLHLETAVLTSLPQCTDVTPSETCEYGQKIIGTATILNR